MSYLQVQSTTPPAPAAAPATAFPVEQRGGAKVRDAASDALDLDVPLREHEPATISRNDQSAATTTIECSDTGITAHSGAHSGGAIEGTGWAHQLALELRGMPSIPAIPKVRSSSVEIGTFIKSSLLTHIHLFIINLTFLGECMACIKDQLELVVSAVVSTLSNTAQVEATRKAQQQTSTIATRTRTRSGSSSSTGTAGAAAAAATPRASPAAQAAAKFAKEVDRWLQGLDVEVALADVRSEIDAHGICFDALPQSDVAAMVDAAADKASHYCAPSMVATNKPLSHGAPAPLPAPNSASVASTRPAFTCFVDPCFTSEGETRGNNSNSCQNSNSNGPAKQAAQEQIQTQQEQEPRRPLAVLPENIRDQIQRASSRKSLVSAGGSESAGRVAKWVRPAGQVEDGPQDMRSILEKRIGEMR